MGTINIDTIKADLEEHKKLVSSIKENKQNHIIETKKSKNIAEFVESIELF